MHGIGFLPKDQYDTVIKITDDAINSAMLEISYKFKSINKLIDNVNKGEVDFYKG